MIIEKADKLKACCGWMKIGKGLHFNKEESSEATFNMKQATFWSAEVNYDIW